MRLALPLNTARPVLYYNRDAFRRAKLNPQVAPKTWYDMAGVLGRLADSARLAPITTAWPAWVMMENSGGELSRQLMVRWTSMLAPGRSPATSPISGGAERGGARFAAGECAVLTVLLRKRAELAKQAHFELGVAPLPYYDDSARSARPAGEPARRSGSQRPSVGVASFFAYLARVPPKDARVPRAPEKELEAVWRGDKTALDALEASRGAPPSGKHASALQAARHEFLAVVALQLLVGRLLVAGLHALLLRLLRPASLLAAALQACAHEFLALVAFLFFAPA